MKEKRLIVIVGPTGVGKSNLALKLAEQYNCSIISADSRQIFKELNIGTAKLSYQDMKGIKHHFINELNIWQDYDAGNFEKDALNTIKKEFTDSDNLIMAGGSGLFIKAVCEGLDKMPPKNLKIRTELMSDLQKNGIEKLVDELRLADSDYYKEVDLQNPRRIIRALEVIRSTDKPYTYYRKGLKKKRPFKILKIGLKLNRDVLYEKIDSRVDEMVAMGLFDEVELLLKYKEMNALQTVGYKEIIDFYEKKQDKETTIELIKRNSRRYAKRQLTWFNKDEKVVWFDAHDYESIFDYLTSN